MATRAAAQAVAVAEVMAAALAPEREAQFSILMTEAQCTELSVGRVPAEVQELARTLVDWTQEDLRRNAAKPVYRGRRR